MEISLSKHTFKLNNSSFSLDWTFWSCKIGVNECSGEQKLMRYF